LHFQKKIYKFTEENKSIYKTNEISLENNFIYTLYMDSLYNFLCSENDIFLCYYFLDKLNNYNNNKILIYKNVLMKSAIKIDDDFLVFKSNKVASKGMSQLLLYNFRVKKDNYLF